MLAVQVMCNQTSSLILNRLVKYNQMGQKTQMEALKPSQIERIINRQHQEILKFPSLHKNLTQFYLPIKNLKPKENTLSSIVTIRSSREREAT